MGIEVRAVTDAELDDAVRAVMASYGQHAGDDDLADMRALAELDRTLVAFDDGRPVGMAAAITLEVTVPGGGTVTGAGFTDIGVLPTHRRRGVLTALLGAHLEASRARGEPVSALVAAEGGIYNRFGFGVATFASSGELDPRRGGFLSPVNLAGDLRLLGPEEMVLLLPEAYERYRRAQPGEVSRSEAFWDVLFHDRDGAGARFAVAHETPGGDVDGYAVYRVREAWAHGSPAFELDVEELVTPLPAVRARLWRFLLDVDLVASVRAVNLPIDDPLRWLLADPRALRTTAVRDMLWVRLVDVPAALAARRYPVAARVVLDVEGAGGGLRGSNPVTGRYLLDGSPHGAECRPCADQGPDLSINLADLGAAYLGGVRLSTLARAGRVVEHTRGMLARADTLFSVDPPPHCQTDF